MEVRNHTPLRPLVFESRDLRDGPFYAVVARGTFRIGEGALVLHTDQAPPVEADQYRGDPGRSSVRVKSDLAPPKRRGDLTLDAVARAPGGRPATEWMAGVRVGRYVEAEDRPRSLLSSRSRVQPELQWVLSHLARVTGPRAWTRGVTGWRPGPPAPCVEVPLSYEHAFGGSYAVPGGTVTYDQNPVGVGFFDPSKPPGGPVAMPQVEGVSDPVEVAGQPYAPVGFGPVGRAWTPRRALAGTYGQAWLRDRAPRPPADFDPLFHNGAPAPLHLPRPFDGDETVSVLGVGGEIGFRLPGLRVWSLVRRRSGAMESVPCVLDTVHLDLAAADPSEHRVSLVWRAAVSLGDPVRVVELRMASPETVSTPAAARLPSRSWPS